MKKGLILISIFGVLFSACTSPSKKKKSSTELLTSQIQPTSAGDSKTSLISTSEFSVTSNTSITSLTSVISNSSSSQGPIVNKWCSQIHDAFIYTIGEELPYLANLDDFSKYTPITSTYCAAFYLSDKLSSSPLTSYNNELMNCGWTFSETITDPDSGAKDYVFKKGQLEVRTSYYAGDFYIYAISEDNYPTETPITKDVLLNSDFPSSYIAGTGSFSEGTFSSSNISSQNGDIQFKKDGSKLIFNNIKASQIFFLFSNVGKGSPSTLMVKAGTSKNDCRAVQYINGFVTINNSPYVEVYSLGFTSITFGGIASIA